MEAGVDIGALNAVLHGEHAADALQLSAACRTRRAPRSAAGRRAHGRLATSPTTRRISATPRSITSDPPPAPYLATDQEEIIRRVMRAEALRLGFDAVAQLEDDFDGGISVHGHFGTAEGWRTNAARRRIVADTLNRDQARLLGVCRGATRQDTLQAGRRGSSPSGR